MDPLSGLFARQGAQPAFLLRTQMAAPFALELADGADRFTVRVHDPSDPAQPDEDDGLALALVGSLAGGVEQAPHPDGGTVLSLWWPLAEPGSAGR